MASEQAKETSFPLRDEVLRRVGRNLLLFQQIELLMKFLVMNVSLETGPSGPLAEQHARHEAIRKKSLGQIREQFFEALFTDPPERAEDAPITEPRVTFSFRISGVQAEQLEQEMARFEAMTDERNELAHHFVERFNIWESVSAESALRYLDEQRERTLPLHERVKSLHDTLVQGRKDMAAFFQSPDGIAAMNLMHLQSSRIVALLASATHTLARKDGWTLLSSAGHFIAKHDPEQLPSIRKRFGHKGLQALIAAAELFEIREEPIDNGGTRTIYRIRPDAIH